MFTKPASSVRLIAVVFLWQWLLLEYVLLLYPGSRINGFMIGDDFAILYRAAGHFLSGQSPYIDPTFIPLPSALLVPLALHPMPYARAAGAFMIINATVVIAAMLWLCRALRLNRTNALLVMAITLTYGPAYSALGEGNLDALMAALLVACCARHQVIRIAAWGLSIGTKFYTLLLLPVWTLQRRWREVLLGVAVLAAVLLPFWPNLPAAFHSLTHRTGYYFAKGNQSPALLFIECFGFSRKWLWRACYLGLWAGTLLPRLLRDFAADVPQDQRRWQTLKYIPWMASAPILVLYYTGVILLPFMAMLVATNQQRPLRRAEWLMVIGFIFTGLYPWIFNLIMAFPDPVLAHFDFLFRALAPFGLALILVGNGLTALLERLDRPFRSGFVTPQL